MVVSIVVIGLAGIWIMLAPVRFGLHRLEVKSCFVDVQGLKPGAEVRIAGVNVGTVRSVRSNPQNKDCPAEIAMDLATMYELSVPRDSLTEIDSSGVLGASFVSIDTSQSSGSSIENYGYLKSKPTKRPLSAEEALRAIRVLFELATERKAAGAASTDKVPVPDYKPRP